MKAVMIASVAFIASASVAVAAEIEPVITPGPFAPPPAYPRVQASQEPTVAPGPFAPPPAFPVARIYNWTGLYVGINGGGAFGTTAWTSVPDATGGRSNVSGGDEYYNATQRKVPFHTSCLRRWDPGTVEYRYNGTEIPTTGR